MLYVRHTDSYGGKMDRKIIKYAPAITMLPAVLIGLFAMYLNDVPTFIFIQNLLCFGVLQLVYFATEKSKVRFNKIEPIVYIVICSLSLLLTLINPGTEGVHRWVAVGPVQLYISSIVVPIIIINTWRLLEEDKIKTAIISVICVAVVLTLQPDASMVTAFSVVSTILLWNKINNFSRSICVLFLGGLTVLTWVFLDVLEPVTYVEGILKLVMDMGILWSVFGVVSLSLTILPFLIFPPNKNKLVSISFGIYFIIIFISNIFGNFPVPLMGYGISPIIGYFISIQWYTKNIN